MHFIQCQFQPAACQQNRVVVKKTSSDYNPLFPPISMTISNSGHKKTHHAMFLRFGQWYASAEIEWWLQPCILQLQILYQPDSMLSTIQIILINKKDTWLRYSKIRNTSDYSNISILTNSTCMHCTPTYDHPQFL